MTTPTPQITRYFHHPGHFDLDGGQTLPSYNLAYQTWGKLNSSGTNAILIFHALSGDSHVAGPHEDGRTNGWWDLMVGPGKAFNTERFFIVCANVLGGCKGSTGPSSNDPLSGNHYGMTFPVITLEDMARAQFPLLVHLGIKRLHTVAGGSMGGMLTLAFSGLFPGFAERAIVMAAGPSNHAQAIAWNEIGRRAIMADPLWKEGNYYEAADGPPRVGLGIARMIGHVTYISEGAMDQKFGRRLQNGQHRSFGFGIDYAVESYLGHQAKVFHQRFDANSYLYITRALDYFSFAGEGDLITKFRSTKSRYRFFSYDADWLYTPLRHQEMTLAARTAGREAVHHLIEAPLGHDAFLVQADPQEDLVREFLAG